MGFNASQSSRAWSGRTEKPVREIRLGGLSQATGIQPLTTVAYQQHPAPVSSPVRNSCRVSSTHLNLLLPQILEEKADLFFHLQQQRLIELVRAGKVEEALAFAQEFLAPCGEENPAFLEELGACWAAYPQGSVQGRHVGSCDKVSKQTGLV